MLLIVGRIGRPHGVRGEVTVEVRTDEPEERFAVGSVLRTDPAAASSARPAAGPAASAAAGQVESAAVEPETGVFVVPETLTVDAVRWHQGRPLVTFDGVYDRDLAEALRDVLLLVESDEIGAPEDPDEFHDHQLVGLAVVDRAGERLGEVARIDHAPASDLLVLRRPEGRTALIPFVRAMVPEVDLAGGRVVVDLPDGLLDL
jgi:16S rRNA processing protein RimM